MELIQCKDLSIGYEGQEVAGGLTFRICEGDYLYILGENGSGKSTLMKTLLGLIPPLSGELIRDPGFSQKETGYLPQQTQIRRDFPSSVKEIVYSGCMNPSFLHPFLKAEDKKLAEESMKKMRIDDLRDRSFRDLSGGQQQRVLLARTLAVKKRLLVLDEPVTGLDPETMQDMYHLIQELHKEGITIVMISHDPEAAEKYATHILSFDSGVRFETADRYFGRETEEVHGMDLCAAG